MLPCAITPSRLTDRPLKEYDICTLHFQLLETYTNARDKITGKVMV
nr:MAG TPA: hypothetical protein [Caudoviricetes sp.]